MTPDFEILAERQDITERLRQRLISLTVSDQNGEQNDSLSIVLENDGEHIALPDPGAVLTVKLGYLGHPSRDMGKWVLDEIRASGPPSQLTLTARAGSHGGTSKTEPYAPLQTQKTCSWEAGLSMGDIVRTIAAEALLEPRVKPYAAALIMPHLDQVDESDLAFLTRLAKAYGCVVKAAFGKLIFAHTSDIADAARSRGSASDAVTVHRNECTQWEYACKSRPVTDAVIATWRDKAASRDVEERIGIGTEAPRIKRLPGVFVDQRTARAAAEAAYMDAQREGTTFDITLPAPPAMHFYPEGQILATGFAPPIDMIWQIAQIEWALSSSGFSVSLQCSTAAHSPNDYRSPPL
jgi:phage protein D